MRFGSVPVAEAEGAILAHATQAGDIRLKKGTRLDADAVRRLEAAGFTEVVVADLAEGDLDEDAAATRIAAAFASPTVSVRPAATGRVNLHADAAGVFTVDRSVIDRVNAIDPAITVATLADHVAVERGAMVATVKIIPFAVAADLVDQALAEAGNGAPIAVHPFRPHSVGVVQTELPSLKPSVLTKTVKVTAERLSRSGSAISRELRTPHAAPAVARALEAVLPQSDVAIVFGASALCDFDDVIPAAIRLAGGRVERTGMPVDPGNLLVLGEIGGKPVIGAPGCARSPKENGFDWILDRLFAGLPVDDRVVAGLGVGGLLMEIASRPYPREKAESAAGPVDAIVLAAGRSSRMGGPNKLLATFDGMPLIRRVVEATMAGGARKTVVVTGHQAQRVEAALVGTGVDFVHNGDFAAGLSTSIKAGLAALDEAAAGALVVLGDMPGVGAGDLRRMVKAFRGSEGRSIVRATHAGKRGNPVLLPRRLFAEIARLEGDAGARHLVENDALPVIDVELGSAATMDVDTPKAMEEAGGVLQD